ncbi:MAG: ATP-binding cassette domain-containing protein [Candidatus Stygibacter australis]|nr:ATP-binding cassette domain-containing protein [Candidatus Stygibacter australis]MDP8321398.1 ATP-binding cassette domain-containing protein [Candidatus Stygibacter australis]
MIRLENLVKDYGTVRAVDHINFEIHDGEILGFLGPNGAGKSTTLKMITCYLSPTKGNIHVDGDNVIENSLEIRKRIGYLPEQNPLYAEMLVYDYLKFVAEIRQVKNFKARLKEIIELCGLHGVVQKPIQTLSKGYKQRVGIAQAIIHDPEILILDEPTSGLDPNQIVEIRELIKELGKAKTLIISSHILQEVQAVCDRIVIIHEGKIVADGSSDQLKADMNKRMTVKLQLTANSEEIEEMLNLLGNIKLIKLNQGNEVTDVVLEFDSIVDRRPDIFNYMKKKDWALFEMHRDDVSLEAVFRKLTVDGGK